METSYEVTFHNCNKIIPSRIYLLAQYPRKVQTILEEKSFINAIILFKTVIKGKYIVPYLCAIPFQ